MIQGHMTKLICLVFLTTFISTTYSAQDHSVPSLHPHPGYTNTDILPPGWEQAKNNFGGVAWLEDGRLVALQYNGGNNGKAFLFSNVLTAKSGADLQIEEIHTGFRQPLGVEVVEGDIYVIEKDKFSKLTKNGNSWDYSMVYDGHNPLIERNYGHWFSMGLVYHDAKFYWSLGGFNAYNAWVDPTPERHGTLVEYDPLNNTHKFIGHGFRNTGGVAVGPDGEICTNDNQGDWMPSDKFICVQEGKWYGLNGPDAPMAQGRSEYPPTVWNTHTAYNRTRDWMTNKDTVYTQFDDLGNSPGEMRMLKKGIYAGHLLMTDVNDAWLTRLQLERVKGELQGANFFFSGGFRSGTYRLEYSPDGESIIVAGQGGDGGGWKYAQTYTSLHRLDPNGQTIFDFLAIRSKSNTQMEVEFTKSANAAAGTASNYDVYIWENIASRGYGAGHKSNMAKLNVSNVTLSENNTKALLTIPGLKERHVVRIKISDNVKSTTGETLWAGFGDYTMNNFGPADPVSVKHKAGLRSGFDFSIRKQTESIQLKLETHGNYEVTVMDLLGKRKQLFTNIKQGTLSIADLEKGIIFLKIDNGKHSVTEKVWVQ